ncbi:MAG: hypothetical protein Q8K92_02780, partial [Leadbetterella sp.]|nr:hypothetical protein [Leadbetterella sp.]
MKNSVVILLLTISVTLFGQTTKLEPKSSEWASPYTLDLPKDWKVERFLIPIAFAPQISYRGVEDIRFM